MKRRRRLGPAVGATVTVVLLLALFIAPAAAGRAVKGAYHRLPGPVHDVVPDALERTLGGAVDRSVRFFSLGNPDVLVDNDLRLVRSSPPPGVWSPDRDVVLAWTDLGNANIRYEVRFSPSGPSADEAVVAGITSDASGNVTLPGDGEFVVDVQPFTASKRGQVTRFGPFLVDATPPASPTIHPRGNATGYRFQITWSASSDVSRIVGYDVERSLNGGSFATLARVSQASLLEDQVGNGLYAYRVRAVNGAGLRSPPSASLNVTVEAPMQNPGAGALDYGIHANYTGFLHLWDLSNMDQYARLDGIPASLKSKYLQAAYGIEFENATLRSLVGEIVGSETNAARIAEKLFIYLFDHTDYDAAKRDAGGNLPLQRAGETLDRGSGICGDLAVLYVTMLRIAGVPARPIHGYLDNTLAGVGGFHMWVEVYVGPEGADRPWMTVDVSGVTGPYEPDKLFSYFGIFNPDYLALGEEIDYKDESWNTWARFSYSTPRNAPEPNVEDQTTVVEYATEEGCLFFDEESRRTQYVAEGTDGECSARGMSWASGYYKDIKRVSQKRIDYGANVDGALPNCLTIRLRYPFVDEFGALSPSQSSIYHSYEGSSSARATVGSPEPDGWIRFTDGTSANCGS